MWNLSIKFLRRKKHEIRLSDDTYAEAKKLLAQGEKRTAKFKETGSSAVLLSAVDAFERAIFIVSELPSDSKRNQLMNRLIAARTQAINVGPYDSTEAVRTRGPFAFLISYPRSGNTMMSSMLMQYSQAERRAALAGSIMRFDKRIYDRQRISPLLVKDHQYRNSYNADRCILMLRDGRDTMISLAFMAMQHGSYKPADADDLAAFIRYTAAEYPFGTWADHARSVLALRADPRKLIVKYEDIQGSVDSFHSVLKFFLQTDEINLPKARRVYEDRQSSFEEIKKNSGTAFGKKWGFGVEIRPGSLFERWSKARGLSTWRETWNRSARRAFHETGATEMLIELGYESDPHWWQD